MNTIERVSRAMCKASGIDPDFTGYQSGPADDARPNWLRIAGQAQAAIAALSDLGESRDWPRYSEGEWSRRNVEAFVADVLGEPKT